MIQIDIDKPARCIDCPLCVDYDCIIQMRVTGFYTDDLQEQYRHCPLIPVNPHHWCTDCQEYDHERHCCPRFNRVIRETVDEVKSNQWIPCSEKMPESNGTYLVYAPDYQGGSSSAKEWHNGVMFAKFKHGKWSVEVGYYNRPGCVRAWMPLPEPYKGEPNERD